MVRMKRVVVWWWERRCFDAVVLERSMWGDVFYINKTSEAVMDVSSAAGKDGPIGAGLWLTGLVLGACCLPISEQNEQNVLKREMRRHSRSRSRRYVGACKQ